MYRFDQFLSARSAFGPRFSRDGARIFFLSDLSGAPQLWSIRLGTERCWPEPVAVAFDRVTGAWPSPCSDRVIVTADVGGNERTQLHLIEQPGATPRALTSNLDTIHQFGGWHPDGRTVAFSSNERDARFFDAYVLDVETGERRQVFQGDGTYYATGISPDGRSLLLQEAGSAWEHTLLVVDLASGAARRLTPEAPAARYKQICWGADSRTVYCVSDVGRDFLGLAALSAETGRLRWVAQPDWDIDDFALAPAGDRVVYQVNVDGYSDVRVHDLATAVESVIPIPRGQAYEPYKWFPTFSWSPDGSQIAFTFAAANRPANIFVAPADGGAAPKRVTDAWSGDLDLDDLATAELIHYPTFDGREIPAFVYKPRGHRPDGSSPAVFYVHGGPESQIRTMYNGVIQYFVHRGFVVVAPNVRGSLGYGREYVHLDDVEKRPDSVRDLAEAARWAGATGLAHPGRLAVMGASYGGFMVLASLTSYPKLWAAGIDIVGIANFVTFLERTGPWRRHHREVEYGSLAHDRAVLEAISPLHQADQIEAPLMVIHGANDPRVPITEAEQIVALLQQRRRPVEYLRFEDEGHGLAKLRNRVQAYPQVASFLERHLATPRAVEAIAAFA
jgi:dipeptidyl aminopeptidase/acylaminoacyl peptidase